MHIQCVHTAAQILRTSTLISDFNCLICFREIIMDFTPRKTKRVHLLFMQFYSQFNSNRNIINDKMNLLFHEFKSFLNVLYIYKKNFRHCLKYCLLNILIIKQPCAYMLYYRLKCRRLCKILCENPCRFRYNISRVKKLTYETTWVMVLIPTQFFL